MDEPTNGVDPVSRRDFWAILYGLVKEGMTVFVTTSYMDEAERCNRVGLMYKGVLIRCDSPEKIKGDLEEACYEVRSPDQRSTRKVLTKCDGVLSIEASGPTLHLFLSPAETSPKKLEQELNQRGIYPVEFKKTAPSLEDVFIALIQKASKEGSSQCDRTTDS